MGSFTAAIDPRILETEPRELLGLVALPSEIDRAPKQLSGSANDLIRSVAYVLDDMVVRTLRQRTAEDFDKVRKEVFPQYFATMMALGALIKVAVPSRDVEWLRAQSLSELEAQFRDQGAATIGAELRDRGLFTVWVLKKISDLAQHIERQPLSTVAKDKDRKMAVEFAAHAMWARFHVDCLIKSMSAKMPIFPEVTGEIVNGLRAVVNAYALIRQGVELRSVGPEPEMFPIPWDAEDEEILLDSMRDLDRDER